MANSIKIRAKARKGVIDIRALMSHPMETGLRKNKTGGTYPEHFIKNMLVKVNGNVVIDGDINATMSKDPYLRVQAEGKKGDLVEISWVDNKGAEGYGKKKV